MSVTTQRDRLAEDAAASPLEEVQPSTRPADRTADGATDRLAERMERSLADAETALEEARLHGDLADAAPADGAPAAAQPRATEPGVATRLKLSILMPVYNERSTIEEIVGRVREQGLHDELVIVDDCSTDGTRDLLIELDAQHEDVRVLMHGYNRGKGANNNDSQQQGSCRVLEASKGLN